MPTTVKNEPGSDRINGTSEQSSLRRDATQQGEGGEQAGVRRCGKAVHDESVSVSCCNEVKIEAVKGKECQAMQEKD